MVIHTVGTAYSKHGFDAALRYLHLIYTNVLNQAQQYPNVESISLPTYVIGITEEEETRCIDYVLSAVIDWMVRNKDKTLIKSIRIVHE
jgi:hypothetical protein